MNRSKLEFTSYDKAVTEARKANALDPLMTHFPAAIHTDGYGPSAIDGVLASETQSALRLS